MAKDQGPSREEIDALAAEIRERGERNAKDLARRLKEAEAYLSEKATGDPRKKS